MDQSTQQSGLASSTYYVNGLGLQPPSAQPVRRRRWWKAALAVVVIGALGLLCANLNTPSPDNALRRQLEEGDRLAERGDIAHAARHYLEVAAGDSDMANQATERFRNLLAAPLDAAGLDDAVEVFRVALSWPRESSLRDQLAQRGLELLAVRNAVDSRSGIALLDLIGPTAPDRDAFLRERRKLLERWHAAAADSLDIVDALALTYEQMADIDAADRLLTPHESHLGTLEGARVLGQTRLRQGKADIGIRFLVPYVEQHLPPLRQAVRAVQKAREALAENIRAHIVDDFPYRRYENASEDQRREIEWHFLHVQATEDASLQATLKTLASYQHVRSAVLDLAQALLDRSRSSTADNATKAEELFLAVREIDGDRGDPRLRLAQVKFWLGRDADGRKLIEDVLVAEKRNFDALLRASYLYRDVGAAEDARKLLEEAFAKETELPRRHRAAELRAILPVDLEDRLRWLERADPESQNVVGLLHSTRGYLARERGQDQEASDYLLKAVKLYDDMPRSPATLNNGGLACLALYNVNGDKAMLDRGVAMLEQAIAQHPGDTVLLNNALDGVLSVALQDVLGKGIALDALRCRGRIEFLSFLYSDAVGRDQLTERIRQHPGFVKSRALAEKLALLAPRQPAGYNALCSIHFVTRNGDELRRLDGQLASANLDLSAAIRSQRDRIEGRADGRIKEELTANIARLEKVCEQFHEPADGMMYAVPRTLLARTMMQRPEVGLEVNTDTVVKMAEQAHAAVPSRMTRQTLASASFFRVHRRLIAEDRQYAELAAKSVRTLDAGTRLAVALDRDASLKARFAQDRDYRRACELLRENSRAFPDEPSPWVEKLLRPVYPEDADQIAAALKNDEMGQRLRSIALRLAPWNLAVGLEQAWFLRMMGKEEEAKAVLQRAAAIGVPVPNDLR